MVELVEIRDLKGNVGDLIVSQVQINKGQTIADFFGDLLDIVLAEISESQFFKPANRRRYFFYAIMLKIT